MLDALLSIRVFGLTDPRGMARLSVGALVVFLGFTGWSVSVASSEVRFLR